MRKMVLTMQVSADGYVGDAAGALEWTRPTLDPAASDWLLETAWGADLHVMGRRAYRAMAARWGRSRRPEAAPFNRIGKAVFSNTLAEAHWPQTVIMTGDLSGEVRRLKASRGGYALVHGGARLARSLIEADLIDEYRLLIHPTLVREGVTLFERTPQLDLQSRESFPSGAIGAVYRPKDFSSADVGHGPAGSS